MLKFYGSSIIWCQQWFCHDGFVVDGPEVLIGFLGLLVIFTLFCICCCCFAFIKKACQSEEKGLNRNGKKTGKKMARKKFEYSTV